jgi:hypothetical protein
MHGLSSSCGYKGPTIRSYDVSHDGRRFLMIKDSDPRLYATKITVVMNWAQEVRQIMADAAAPR